MSTKKERPVIVTTEYRGVFFGYADNTDGDAIHLRGAKMAIQYGTKRGLFELAETGPTGKSMISAPADIELRKITSVIEVANEAEGAWKKA